MTQLAYWKNWPRPYRLLFVVLLVVLAGSILYFLLSLFYGNEFVIQWALSPSLEPVQLPLPAWQHPLLNVQVTVDTFVVEQTFWGTPFQVNKLAAVFSLGFFLVALTVALTAVTTFSRFWYLLGITAFCAVIILLRLEQLGVWGRLDNTAALVVFLLSLPLSYYFHAIRPQSSFLLRLGAFAVLFAALTLLLGIFATVPVPYLYVVNYGLPAWLGLSLLLMVLVAPEIIAGILYLVTNNNTETSKGSLRHFLLASLLYLLNLLLFYLQEREYLDLDLYLIGPYWILLISIIAGIWTLRHRGVRIQNMLQTEPFGLMLYLALAMLTLSTLAYATATANDSLLESFEDAILYTHLGMGLAFLLYIIANFLTLLYSNQRVYRVLYQPKFMPLFTARFMGIILVAALYALRGSWGYFQPMAGYYNAIGDLYAVQGDLVVSQNYYRLGSQYHFRNHRSNYALASLALGANQAKPAILYLQQALERQPTPYAYANLANLYKQRDMFFDALFTLRQGTDRFPLAGALYNNLGLTYGAIQLTDSAFYYLRTAAEDETSEEAALANMLAVLARQGVAISPDSLLSWDTRDNLALQNNLLALANRNGYRLQDLMNPMQAMERDSSLVLPSYLLNYALQTGKADTALISAVRQRYEAAKLSAFEEQWGLAYALMLYQLPDYYGAFATMQDLADRSQFNNIIYYKILGQWALEQQAPRLAADWFREAHMRGDAAAGFFRALALAEAGKPTEAAELWVNLPDTLLPASWRNKKTQALLALSNNNIEEAPAAEELAALRLRLRPSTLIPAEINALLNSITPPAARAEALLGLYRLSLQENNTAQARSYLQQLQQLQASLGQQQQERLQALQLRYQVQPTAAAISEEALAPLLQLQLRAMQQLAEKDTAAALQPLTALAAASPFEEAALIKTAQLLNRQGQEEQAYNLLRQSLQLNKYSIPLLEAYALQSLRLGLDEYAADALLTLEIESTAERHGKFLTRYNQLQETLENQLRW